MRIFSLWLLVTWKSLVAGRVRVLLEEKNIYIDTKLRLAIHFNIKSCEQIWEWFEDPQVHISSIYVHAWSRWHENVINAVMHTYSLVMVDKIRVDTFHLTMDKMHQNAKTHLNCQGTHIRDIKGHLGTFCISGCLLSIERIKLTVMYVAYQLDAIILKSTWWYLVVPLWHD